jgi:hypothetical protein
MLKHYETTQMHPYSLKAFKQYQEHGKKCCGLKDFNLINTTKQTTFLYG